MICFLLFLASFIGISARFTTLLKI